MAKGLAGIIAVLPKGKGAMPSKDEEASEPEAEETTTARARRDSRRVRRRPRTSTRR